MRYRIDTREPIADDQIAFYTKWIGGPTLAGVGNCRVHGLPASRRYSIRVTGEPDSAFSIPAETTIRGRRIPGYLTAWRGEDGASDVHAYEFRPDRVGRCRMWRMLLPRAERMLILHDIAAGWHSGQTSRGYRVLSRTAMWLQRRRIGQYIAGVQTVGGDPLRTAEYLQDRDPICRAFAAYVVATFTVRDDARTLSSLRRYQRRAAF